MCSLSERLFLQYGCSSRMHCQTNANAWGLQHLWETEHSAVWLLHHILLSTLYVPESPCSLCISLTTPVKALLLWSPPHKQKKKWKTERLKSNCQNKIKKQRQDMNLNHAFPTAWNLKGTQKIAGTLVCTVPSTLSVSGVGITLAINAFRESIHSEFPLLCFVTLITLLFHISYPCFEHSTQVHALLNPYPAP